MLLLSKESGRRSAPLLAMLLFESRADTSGSYWLPDGNPYLQTYLRRTAIFLQRARKRQVAEEERRHCHRRQVHPPIGRQDAVLLQATQQISPAWRRLRYTEPKKRQRYFGENILWN